MSHSGDPTRRELVDIQSFFVFGNTERLSDTDGKRSGPSIKTCWLAQNPCETLCTLSKG